MSFVGGRPELFAWGTRRDTDPTEGPQFMCSTCGGNIFTEIVNAHGSPGNRYKYNYHAEGGKEGAPSCKQHGWVPESHGG